MSLSVDPSDLNSAARENQGLKFEESLRGNFCHTQAAFSLIDGFLLSSVDVDGTYERGSLLVDDKTERK